MLDVQSKPIGVIRSPFKILEGMPIQTVAAEGVRALIELEPEYTAGLKDVADFSYLWLLVHLHQVQGYTLAVTPFMDTQLRGVFATRSPRRPNPIGLSLVRLIAVEGTTLHIE